MIRNTKTEFQIIGNEKDFLKFYHANFLEPLDKSDIQWLSLSQFQARGWCPVFVADFLKEAERRRVFFSPSEGVV